MAFVTQKDPTHMFDMPVLVIQLGDVLVYIRRAELQRWDCTPTPETEIQIKWQIILIYFFFQPMFFTCDKEVLMHY